MFLLSHWDIFQNKHRLCQGRRSSRGPCSTWLKCHFWRIWVRPSTLHRGKSMQCPNTDGCLYVSLWVYIINRFECICLWCTVCLGKCLFILLYRKEFEVKPHDRSAFIFRKYRQRDTKNNKWIIMNKTIIHKAPFRAIVTSTCTFWIYYRTSQIRGCFCLSITVFLGL